MINTTTNNNNNNNDNNNNKPPCRDRPRMLGAPGRPHTSRTASVEVVVIVIVIVIVIATATVIVIVIVVVAVIASVRRCPSRHRPPAGSSLVLGSGCYRMLCYIQKCTSKGV